MIEATLNGPQKVSPEFAERLVRFVAKLYRMDKWSFRVAVVGDNTLEGAMGDCDYCSQSLSAFIRIRENQDSLEALVDTVVHEITHCVLWWADYHLDPTGDNKLRAAVLEQSLRDLTAPVTRYILDHLKEVLN